MENTKRKVPVWAIILYAVTGLLLLAGVALIIFSAIDSATLLPYKRQNISEYFSDETHYYTVAGTVEELSVGTLADGAYPLTLTLDGVVSDEEGINEHGRVTFTVPAETYSALAERGFFDALQVGAAVEFYMAWNVWGKTEIAVFTEVSVEGTPFLDAAPALAALEDWIRNDLN